MPYPPNVTGVLVIEFQLISPCIMGKEQEYCVYVVQLA